MLKIEFKVKILLRGITTMSGRLGGQIRTIQCGCGWQCRKQLQEANKLYKLHMRLTHKQDAVPMGEFDNTQGKKGLGQTKHGNLKYTPLTPTEITKVEIKN